MSQSTQSQSRAIGVWYKCIFACPGFCDVIGGSISTRSGNEKELRVYDLDRSLAAVNQLRVRGTRFSKWGRSVKSAGRRQSTVQRTLGVSPATDNAVLASTVLTGSEQEITTGITNPDAYRVLSVKGSPNVGTDKIVYIIGTNFAGETITDAITLNADNVVVGKKPFATITKIILPASVLSNSVSVGTSNKLGLQFPIGDAAAVIQIGRKTAAASSYSIELLTSYSINVDFATVGPSTIAAGDSFEFVVLASQ